MRLVFLGTPEFAVPSLERVKGSGRTVLSVYTQPDRPRGRGREVSFSPVKQAALRLALQVQQPERIRHAAVVDELRVLGADAMVVVGYGQIIPQAIIDLPRLGIINVHASLLPAYRGAAPIQWAIARGESLTGVTTMRINAGLDTGDILLARPAPIGPEETAIELGARLAETGADLLVETLDGLESQSIAPVPQDDSRATYAPLLAKEDGLIEWSLEARTIVDRVRGFQPWPGAHTLFGGRRLHIWKARPAEAAVPGRPGSIEISGRRWLVRAGRGAVELVEVQLEGRKRISAEAFLNGVRVDENVTLGGTAPPKETGNFPR